MSKRDKSIRAELLRVKDEETAVCPFNSKHIVRKRKIVKHMHHCPDNPVKSPLFNKAYNKKDTNKPAIDTVTYDNTLLPYLDDLFFNDCFDQSKAKNEYFTCDCYKIQLSLVKEEKLEILMKRIDTLYDHFVELYF